MSGPFPASGTKSGPLPPPVSGGDDGPVSVVIPYKNPKALLAYYLAIAAMIPLIGVFFGIASFILGILGLKDRRLRPEIHGSVHAWIGIIVGGAFGLLWMLLIAGVLIAIIAANSGPQ